MIIEQEEFQKKLKRINLAYFSDPDRIITISKGNAVVRQGEQNKRLYLILSGSVVSSRHVVKEDPETASTSHKIYKAFRPRRLFGSAKFLFRMVPQLLRSHCGN